jgi:protein-S-isoprenylcysteine O-methyltransferase
VRYKELEVGKPAVVFLVIGAPLLALLLALLGLLTMDANLTGWVLIMVGVIYVTGTIIALVFYRSRFEALLGDSAARENHRDRTYWAVTAGMLGAFYLPPAVYLALPGWRCDILPVQIGGIALVLAGAWLFGWARRTLGQYFSGRLAVAAEQPLILNGPYRFIRHPGYAGYLLMALGISVGYASLPGLAVFAAVLLPAMVYRIRIEEGVLAAAFGEGYREYARRASRLLPHVW